MDWQGLLRWSMQYTDGTRPSEFKPMDEETKQWLKDALSSVVVDDNEIMQKGVKILSELETGSPEECEQKEKAAELVLQVIENLDMAQNMVKLGYFKHIIKCMIGSQYPSVRKMCASIFTSAVQNNPIVQANALAEHALEGLCARINEETDLQLKEQYIACLSGLVRGQYSEARNQFIQMKGLDTINLLLVSGESPRIVKKCLLMLSDIIYNTRSKGNEGPTNECLNLGIFETLNYLMNNQDKEIVEMTQWVLHNTEIKC
ncbi:hypothetical protein SteCoe_9799 [Stentor coeruleus]|uniref:Nucleotide exchange factor Fes1 domain-containing protein n=1 Tax=Stentor coeruleus TaxID=5963 RepID=A0A1R2CGZ9_9CILI|nr:hypothetical protein SteCoe_9799 [Stentor coeruleus]